MVALIGATSLTFLAYLTFSERFGVDDPKTEGNLRFAIATSIVAVAALQSVLFPATTSRRLLVAVLLLVAGSDLTRYYWDVGQADRLFSERQWGNPRLLSHEVRATLRRPWSDP